MIRGIVIKTKRLLGYMTGVRTHLALGMLASAASVLLATWMTADMLGNAAAAFEARSVQALVRAVLLALIYLAGIIALRTISAYLTGIATAKACARMRRKLMGTMLESTLGDTHATHSGQKLSYFINDIPAAMGSLVNTLSMPVEALLVGIGGFIYVVSVHWVMAAIAVGIGVFTYIFSVFFAGWLHKIAVLMQKYMAVMESRLKDLLDGMVVARMYAMREKLDGQMGKASGDLMRTGIHWAWASSLLGGINNTTHYFSEKLLIFVAGMLMLSGAVSLPELMRVSQMAGGVVGVFFISRALVDIQRALAGAERVFDYIDKAEYERTGEKTAEDTQVTVCFKDVMFSYDGIVPAFKDLSFSINEGEFIAFTGPSGSGKSTILRLIQGLYRADSGTVEVCGVPVDEWNLRALRAKTALVPQEPVLFPGTIAQNIAMGMDDIDVTKMEAACRDAYAHDFIMEMADGYNTQVVERGASLSGGQRQRIAVARALYRDAPIILLDEATSAMDTDSQAHIHETLSHLKGKKTILFVTHRMAVLNLADKRIQV